MANERPYVDRRCHWTCFGATGLLALLIDAAILTALTRGAGLSPFVARAPAIAIAMIFAWLSNRTFTFGLRGKPRVTEFCRYVVASGFGTIVNYTCFSALLLLRPDIGPVCALALASVVAAGVSYAGYRWFAFAGG